MFMWSDTGTTVPQHAYQIFPIDNSDLVAEKRKGKRRLFMSEPQVRCERAVSAKELVSDVLKGLVGRWNHISK